MTRLFSTPRFCIPAFVAALFVTALAGDAMGQSRFALELDLGSQLPLSPSLHSIARVESDDDVGVPTLVDWKNSLGLHFGVSALISNLEVRYRFESFGWQGERPLCTGDRPATVLPNGEIEDAEVRYTCTDHPRESLPDDTFAMRFHHLSIGPRFYARRQPRAVVRDGITVERQRTQLYAVPFMGFTLARYEHPHIGATLRPGFHVGAGAGAEFPIERRFSLVADLRYTASFVGAAASPQARARRAIATQRGPIGALFDGAHRLGVNVGVRFDFR